MNIIEPSTWAIVRIIILCSFLLWENPFLWWVKIWCPNQWTLGPDLFVSRCSTTKHLGAWVPNCQLLVGEATGRAPSAPGPWWAVPKWAPAAFHSCSLLMRVNKPQTRMLRHCCSTPNGSSLGTASQSSCHLHPPVSRQTTQSQFPQAPRGHPIPGTHHQPSSPLVSLLQQLWLKGKGVASAFWVGAYFHRAVTLWTSLYISKDTHNLPTALTRHPLAGSLGSGPCPCLSRQQWFNDPITCPSYHLTWPWLLGHPLAIWSFLSYFYFLRLVLRILQVYLQQTLEF